MNNIYDSICSVRMYTWAFTLIYVTLMIHRSGSGFGEDIV